MTNQNGPFDNLKRNSAKYEKRNLKSFFEKWDKNLRYPLQNILLRLSDNFKTLITPSILKISSFCKVIMTNQNGPFDNLKRNSAKYEKRNLKSSFEKWDRNLRYPLQEISYYDSCTFNC